MKEIIGKELDKFFGLVQEATKHLSEEDLKSLGQMFGNHKTIRVHDIQEIPPDNIIRNLVRLDDTKQEILNLLTKYKDDPKILLLLMTASAQLLGNFEDNFVLGGKCTYGTYVFAMNDPANTIMRVLEKMEKDEVEIEDENK